MLSLKITCIDAQPDTPKERQIKEVNEYGTFFVPYQTQTSLSVICGGYGGSSHHNEMENMKGKISSRGINI